MIETLLHKPYWVIDILPEQVPEGSSGQYFAVERCWLQPGQNAALRRKYAHPLWAQAGELAKKMGGHDGMDFLMELRLAYCLQNGLPLDQNVYDLASWCCLCELSEKSVRTRSSSIDVPDFTRGAWETTAPLGIESVDLTKMGFGA